jgi:acyl carrier protein
MCGDDGRGTVLKLREFIQRTFLYARPAFVLSDDTSLFEEGILDSMGVIELLEHLEREFGITIDEKDVTEANFATLRAIGRFVTEKQRG